MPASDFTHPTPPHHTARHLDAAGLHSALTDSHRRTRTLFEAYQAALADPALRVPLMEELNPPCWELGHVGWFQEWWIGRFPQRHLGVLANPHAPRAPSRLPGADGWYHSSNVAHDTRWQLPMPGPAATLAYAEDTLAQTLHLLQQAEPDDTGLYLYRLALFHEDMHAEAAVYMAQTLALPLPDALHRAASGTCAQSASPPPDTPQTGRVEATGWTLGAQGSGFWFDNECPGQPVDLPGFDIDLAPVRWADYLPFIEDGGYQNPRWWCASGAQWLASQSGAQPGAVMGAPDAVLPRHLRRLPSAGWEVQRFGQWHPLDPLAPAVHLTWFEAQAWCRWAGRRLPTEAEWECAAHTLPGFGWGQVWEWTDSVFAPFPGFVPHPYQDYSRPWFGTRQVLRGASTATHPRMAHPKYRNFFPPWRNDIHAGFRTCALP